MTLPFHSVHAAIWRSVSSTVSSLRQQAPGARMIGEFAVKHVLREARERVSPPQSSSRTHNESSQS